MIQGLLSFFTSCTGCIIAPRQASLTKQVNPIFCYSKLHKNKQVGTQSKLKLSTTKVCTNTKLIKQTYYSLKLRLLKKIILKDKNKTLKGGLKIHFEYSICVFP